LLSTGLVGSWFFNWANMSVRKLVPPKVVALFAATFPPVEPVPVLEPVPPVEPVPVVLPAAFVPLITMMCS
jgi:hypothetical protein